VAAASVRSYADGETILSEDGRPADHLYVVRTGTVELRHEGHVVDVLQAGELFGHPSLLTGLAPAFDVVARSAASCLLLPQASARVVLDSPAGVEFVAASLRERMVRTGYVAHAQADVRTAHLGSLVHRPAVIVEPGTTVSTTARRMAEADVSCVLVKLAEGRFGVVTDSDLRRRLVAEERAYDTPVSELMAAPALVFPPDRLAIDAMIDMLDAGIHHLPVVDRDGVAVGVVTATDLMYLEGRTPFALRRSIAHAATVDAVIAAARHLPQTAVALVRAGVSAVDVGRVITLTTDTTTLRLLALGFERHGEPPAGWAWLALGSTARREATLASDQDNAMAYADPGGPEVDELYAKVASDVNAGLAAAGLGADPAEVLARNQQWRMSTSEWSQVFREVLEQPDRSRLTRAAVAFDFRQVGGGLDIARPLVEIERAARNHPAFLRRLARTATDFKPAIGFRGRFAVDREGMLDLKHGAAVPISNLARFHALASGVTISSTLDRLHGAEAEGALDGETAAALREAFEAVARIRLEHQVGEVEAGRPPNNMVDPTALPPITRAQLKASLRAVAAAQKSLERFVPLGM
jgi:CBS domain-containing protein